MLAHRTELDIAHKHQLTELVRREVELLRVAQMDERIDSDAAKKLDIGLGDARRRVGQTRTRRILANSGEDLGDGSLDAPSVDGSHVS